MGTITSLSHLVQLQTDGSAQHYNVFIDNRTDQAAATPPVAGQFTSLWKYNKSTGANGDNPPVSPGEAPTRNTLGAFKHVNPPAGKQLWLLGVEAVATTAGTFLLYDRLFHSRGLSGTVTTAQSVAGSVTRNTGGLGNQIWLEIYTQIGATGTTVSASYTNQAGATKTTPLVFIGGAGNREEARLIRMPLADADTGVQSVISVTVTATTGTAGDFGVTIVKPLTRGYIEGPSCTCFRDLLSGIPAMESIEDDACIALAWHAGTVAAPRIDFTYHVVSA